MKILRAIDLYSGIGGWKLGLKMAGIETQTSYEYWEPALETQNANLRSNDKPTDIRDLDITTIGNSVDIIVGSPPCTQFSISNKGGKGNVEEGLRDIKKFLEIVEYAQPRYWAMENVPRVAKILEEEIKGGSLKRYRDLVKYIDVFDATDFGLPQRRRRMIAGNYPIGLFMDYSENKKAPTLGQVLKSLSSRSIVMDSNYGIKLDRSQLTDQNYETALTDEEEIINRANKEHHPVYNGMNFPERYDNPSRTITATCTRISRESIIVSRARGGYRRLTIRERATLQGFPITYQFYGSSYTNKIKMVGNAIPPLFAYYIGCSMLGIDPKVANPHSHLKYKHELPSIIPPNLHPKKSEFSYPRNRRFCFAIRQLRFGSGVRFELINNNKGNNTSWRIVYKYGVPDDIREVRLDSALLKKIEIFLDDKEFMKFVRNILNEIITIPSSELQRVWTHRQSGFSPLDLINSLSNAVDVLLNRIHVSSEDQDRKEFILEQHDLTNTSKGKIINLKRYIENTDKIFVGFLLGSYFNVYRNQRV